MNFLLRTQIQHKPQNTALSPVQPDVVQPVHSQTVRIVLLQKSKDFTFLANHRSQSDLTLIMSIVELRFNWYKC